MPPLEQFSIAGYNSGLRTNQKPFLIPTEAFSRLDNAYVWRERVKKREGLEYFGRLRRVIPAPGVAGAGTYTTTFPGTNTFSIFGASGLNVIGATIPETYAQLEPITLNITFAAPIGQSLTDTAGTGVLNVIGAGPITAATVNYGTGIITVTANAIVGPAAVNLILNYFPTLPVMGIWQRELPAENVEETIFFDQKYAYINSTGADDAFQDITGVTWNSSNSDFFSAVNYRGTNPYDRIFFVTNFNNGANPNPIRYTQNGTVFNTFQPIIADVPQSLVQSLMYQARVLVPYYGRLLALNTWEGTTAGGAAGAQNFFNRCRFSQIGDPLAADAWRSDIFGKGGFIDAPVNEDIVSATFHKNTLIVGFERSTWQLRYVGEYGLPFLWERVSSDFGCESQYSAILFDDGVLQVGDRAITTSSAVGVQRIDLQIPDQVFQFKNDELGTSRVHGIRDFRKELVYWNWVDVNLARAVTWTYPNRTLLYNYRNQTYATFRENITCWGIYQSPIGVTWDRLDIFWNDTSVFWDNENTNPDFPSIVCGNQQGFISYYASSSIEEPSLAISAINLTTNPVQVTIPNHNLATLDWIKIEDAIFLPADTVASGINDRIYQVVVVDADTVQLSYYNNGATGNYTNSSLSLYAGRGLVTLLPKLDLQTKDFNPYQQKGTQFKLSYVDFLVDATPQSVVSVNLIINSSQNTVGNLLIGNTKTDADPYLFGFITGATQANPCIITSPNHGLRTGQQIYITDVVGMTQLNALSYTVTYIDADSFSINVNTSVGYDAYILGGNWRAQNVQYYVPGSDYAWHRFYATTTGQFMRVQLTYNNDLMSNPITHTTDWILDAMSFWMRSGSRNIF